MASKNWLVNLSLPQAERLIDETIMRSSSASIEAKGSYNVANQVVIMKVYERYSFSGGNRVSLSVLMIGNENADKTCVYAVSSGGSTGVFFKVNRIGENSFLEKLDSVFANYI